MRLLRERKGIASIWVALLMMVFISFVGLAIDTGYTVWVGQQLQVGADAAALAGAHHVRRDRAEARVAAVNTAVNNFVVNQPIELSPNDTNDPVGDVVLGRFNRDDGTFDPDSGFPNAVLVNARRTGTSLGGPVDLLFGDIFGRPQTDIGRQAIAINGGGTGAGLLILDSGSECALTVRGDPTFDLSGGDIIVRSYHECGTCYQGSPEIVSTALYTDGGVCITGNENNMILPEYEETYFSDGYEESQLPDDPLYELPDPWLYVADGGAPKGGIFEELPGGGSYPPGYYEDGISLTGGNVVLDPGIYILDGAGLDIRGNTIFTAEGVMFYIVGTGFVDLAGNGEITISPPDPANVDPAYLWDGVGIYEGVSIFQAYDNANESTVLGTSNMDLTGTYYFPRSKVNLGGDANNFGDQFIAWQAEIFGNGTIELAVDGTIPSPGGRVFLVR